MTYNQDFYTTSNLAVKMSFASSEHETVAGIMLCVCRNVKVMERLMAFSDWQGELSIES